jgi:hypothetical protein
MAYAQTSPVQIDPNTQIAWPLSTGSGAPVAMCSALNAGQPYTDITNNVQYYCNGVTWQTGGGGGGSCGGGTCVQINSVVNQNVVQGPQSYLNVNNFEGVYWADQYSATNGITLANAQCLTQNGLGFSGCTERVSPNYANTDSPQGWNTNLYNAGLAASPFFTPGTAVEDYRNGNLFGYYLDPMNVVTNQGAASTVRVDWDLNQSQMAAATDNHIPNITTTQESANDYTGGWDFLPPYSLPSYAYQNYHYGHTNTMNDYTSGITFGYYNTANHRSLGDMIGEFDHYTCDAGDNASNSEGCKVADKLMQEDPVVFAGTVTGTPATGATTIQVNPTQGALTQGSERLLVNISPLYSGPHFTAATGPQTTGSAGNSAIMPPRVSDSTQNFPVSTIVQICYPGSDNGASGAAGCTSGAQPTGYIPEQNTHLSISAGSVASGVATFTIGPTSPQTTPVTLTAGQSVILYGFPLAGAGAFLNGQRVTVSATGLSSTMMEANVTGPDTAAVGTGFSTYGLTGYSPATTITVNVTPSYTGSGGNTNGLPAGFCTPGTLQSSTPGSACYLPASGVGTVTDGLEQESVNFTYNSGSGMVTLSNLLFPHLNGAMFAYGGLAGDAVEDLSSKASNFTSGTTGVIDEIYPIAASLNATTFYYVSQRTNFQYGSPELGGSTDGGNYNGTVPGGGGDTQSALCFSTTMGGFSLSGGVVTFSMGSPAGTANAWPEYNGLVATIAANGDASYNGSYKINFVSGQAFTYTPTAPTGSTPTSGTVSYCNANYNVLSMARVLSVFNPSTRKVDGYFSLMPNTASLNGATVREPHYQKIQIGGTYETVAQFLPKEYLGASSDQETYSGVVSGAAWGHTIVNSAPCGEYLGCGGTLPLPGSPIAFGGLWNSIFSVGTAPGATLFNVTGWNMYGASSAQSSFGVVRLPPLPSAFPGYAVDSFAYNPDYMLSTRGNAMTSGEWTFCNGAYGGQYADNYGPCVSTVATGHFKAVLDTTSPEIIANDVSVVTLTNAPTYSVNAKGTPGSTSYYYEIVAHDQNNGSTVPTGAGFFNTGNATLNGTNYNHICAALNPGVFSYDFLKQVGGVWYSIATNVAAGNGSSFSDVPNYTCFNDQGGATSAYVVPTLNTTGSVAANSVVTAFLTASSYVSTPSLYVTGIAIGDCLQVGALNVIVGVSGGCTGGGGGGMVYPGAGVPNSSGSAWGTSYTVGVGANRLVQLDGSGNMPAISAVNMTGYQYSNLAGTVTTWNQNTTGTADHLTGMNTAAHGGTGLDTSASTGVAQVNAGTWTVGSTLPNGLSATNMTLVNPILGTPTSGLATYLTGLPLSTGITGTLANTHLAGMTANSLLGALTATTPSDIAMPSCYGASNALTWQPGIGPGCNTISGGGGISGGTLGYVPLFGSSTTITTSSPLDYGVTNAGEFTFSVPVVINATGNGFAVVEGTVPSGVASSDLLASVSSVHGWQFNNNNGGWQNMIGSLGGVFTGNITVPCALYSGSTSGTVTVCPQAVAGTPTIQWGTTSGQVATTSAELTTYSATPTFTPGDSLSVIVLTGNITSFTLGATASGTPHTLCFVQGSGSYTVAGPANVHGLGSIGNTNGDYNCQHFTYYAGGTRWNADGGMQINE